LQALAEAKLEEDQRLALIKKANEIAQEDLKAKAQLKESAKVAAMIKMKKSKAFKQKLEAEAREWIAKKEQFDKEDERSQKAQKEAKEAAAKLEKEKEQVNREAKERMSLH